MRFGPDSRGRGAGERSGGEGREEEKAAREGVMGWRGVLAYRESFSLCSSSINSLTSPQ